MFHTSCAAAIVSRVAKLFARLLQAGEEEINRPPVNVRPLFGGVKRSGHGREFGLDGIEEFLAPKAIRS